MKYLSILFLVCALSLPASEISVYVGYDSQWPHTEPHLGVFSDPNPLVESTDIVGYSIKSVEGRTLTIGSRIITEMPIISIQLTESGAEKIRKYRNKAHPAQHLILFLDKAAVSSRSLIGAEKDMQKIYFEPAIFLAGATQSILQMGIPEEYITDGKIKELK